MRECVQLVNASSASQAETPPSLSLSARQLERFFVVSIVTRVVWDFWDIDSMEGQCNNNTGSDRMSVWVCRLPLLEHLVFLVAAKPTTLVEISGFFLSFIFFLLSHEVQKKVQTVQTNMVLYAIWATNFESEVRCDLRGCLEAIVASKPHFLCWSPIDGSS